MARKVEKVRLDVLLVREGHFDSREKAQRAIMAGEVLVGDRRVDKPGTPVPADLPIRVTLKERYVSRGGLKLEAALAAFGIQPAGRLCLDVGASTGGFTDCLLQHGAEKVYAFDVGHDQLDWRIRSDPRVVVREGLNARYLSRADLPESPDLAVADVSFISLTLILPAVVPLLAPMAEMIVLIKPQFELQKHEVGAGGIVRDPALREAAVSRIRTFCGEQRLAEWRGVVPSPVLGQTGNQEFLAWLIKS